VDAGWFGLARKAACMQRSVAERATDEHVRWCGFV
jgi:hypothetical protein